MGSPYATGTASSGSAYAGGPASTGSLYAGGTPAAPQKNSGGGFLGPIEDVAHFVASKAELAGRDIKGIPGGFVKLGEDAARSPWLSTPGGWHGLLQQWEHPFRPVAGDPLASDIQGMVKQSGESLIHPLRDPFLTATTVLPFTNAAAKLGLRGAGVGAETRVLNVPRLVTPKGEGPAALTHEPVQLHASGAPLMRLVQHGTDKIAQRALDKNVVTAEPSRVAGYAIRRAQGSVAESARISQNLRRVQANMLTHAGQGRNAFDEGVGQKTGQLALFLRSANVTGDEAARFWRKQAANGVNPLVTAKLSVLAQQVHDMGLLHQPTAGTVAVDAARFPKLANADSLVTGAQATREGIITDHRLMNDQGLAARKGLVAETIGSEAARNPVTGVREGQGYTPLKTSVKGSPLSAIRQARVPVIGKTKGFINSKQATGLGVAKGLVPDNTTAGVARALHEALRFVNTTDYRSRIAQFGSGIRRTGHDVLVADPALKQGEIPTDINQILGREKSTVGTIPETEHAGLEQAFRAHLEDAIPGLQDSFARDRAAGLGTRAPDGYKWVHQGLLGDLDKQVTPRTGIAKKIDTVNSAVTAATVYFKVGHITTRAFTNATTNIIQGSARPVQIAKSFDLWKQLTPREQAEALAATGTHGVAALPHEGQNLVATLAGKGANWWSRRIDSPFRFNALAYEARRAGVDTPEKFRAMLQQAKNPASNAYDPAVTKQVVQEANRSAIMYDGLSANEKRFLVRGFWFFPWIKGAARFAFHTAAQHPYKTAALGNVGQTGRREQLARLGLGPSYEAGLIPFGGGSHPLTTDMSTFTPFGTTADLAGAVARPGEISGFANPVYGALLSAITGRNQFGGKSTSPLIDALAQLFSPTPEAQIVAAALHPSKPTQMFQKTPLSATERALGGPAVPRQLNKEAFVKAGAREKAGR